MFLDEDEFALVGAQAFVVGDTVTIDDVVAFFERHDLSGGVRRDDRANGPILYLSVLSDEASGEPVRWRERDGAYGLDVIEAGVFARTMARELDAVVLWGDEVNGPDGDTQLFDDSDDRFSLAIERLAFFTRTSMADTGGLLARQLGADVVEASIGRRTLFVPVDRHDVFLTAELWTFADGISLWATRGRRGFTIKRGRNQSVFSWDAELRRIEPASSGRTMSDRETTLESILDTVMAEDTQFAEEAAALGLSGEEAQSLRVLLRRDRSDASTFAAFAELAGLPAVVADVAEGTIEPGDVPGATLRKPQTVRQLVAEQVRQTRDTPDPRLAPFDWWQRLTAKRPLWYTLLTIGLVGGSIAIAAARLAAGQGVESIWIQIGVIVLWTWSYLAPRGRFLDAGTPENANGPASRAP